MKTERIKLIPKQVAWLKMISPATPHKTYKDLRKEKSPNALDALFDNGNFGKFLRGEGSLPREQAETACRAYGTTLAQLEVVQRLPLRVSPSRKATGKDVRADKYAEEFFKTCGNFLWGCPTGTIPADKTPRFPESEPTEGLLLDLVGCVLERKVQLTATQKHLVFGALLDYLLETRQFERWGQWMFSLSHENNRRMFPLIRSGGSDDCFFPGCHRDACGERQYDQGTLEKLTAEELDECAFFVWRLNMSINELRHRNYAEQEDAFERIAEKCGPTSNLFRALQAMRDKGKVPVRNYFRWALENVKPFLEALRHTNNPHRWYFLMCATRLMYDWARWHYYSTLDEDKRAACDMYRDIHELATECSLISDGNAAIDIKCRFYYMAATACRYMAEGASAGIWGRPEEAASYVADAVGFAKRAMEDWTATAAMESTHGEHKALTYRFTRNFARLATFAARWWLMHPTRYGRYLRMPDDTSDEPNMYGVRLLKQANKECMRTICSRLNADDKTKGGRLVLEGKKALEYEFHLRVCIEMLVHAFRVETNGESPAIAASIAMSFFCRMLLIYAYLCRVEADAGYGGKWSAIMPSTVDAARRWLESHDHYSKKRKRDCDSPFDVTLLDGTVQKHPPSIEDTRFEMVCSFKYDSGTQKRVQENALWQTLGMLESLNNVDGRDEFLENVWRPAKMGLEADLAESIAFVKTKAKMFLDKNRTPELRCKHWKEYPPFQIRNALVNAPGNNPAHVSCLMHHYGLDWDAIKNEKEASE